MTDFKIDTFIMALRTIKENLIVHFGSVPDGHFKWKKTNLSSISKTKDKYINLLTSANRSGLSILCNECFKWKNANLTLISKTDDKYTILLTSAKWSAAMEGC